jgi:hypothetical protein
MPLPANFSKGPDEGPHRFFRNVCLHFKKIVQTTKDYRQLEPEIENFINASKEMNWHIKTGDVFRKNAGEKAVQKVLSECDRYYKTLISDPDSATTQGLLDSLSNLEQLIDSFQVS